ncbi:MAG: hypothetical protein N2441_07355 [Rhodocyclaceae bacterium]|nr:hypothetical protein [Rhodocyclaceae bacterium]
MKAFVTTPHNGVLLVWLPLLVGLQSIPGTGALRTVLLLTGMAHLAWLWRHRAPGWSAPPLQAEQRIFLWLTAWIGFVAVFVSPTPSSSLAAWLAEWGKLWLMAAMGIVAAQLFPARRLALALFAGAFLHVLSTLTHQLLSIGRGAGFAFGESLLGNYGYAAPFVTSALAWLLADCLARFRGAAALFPWRLPTTLTLIILSLTADAVLRAKASQLMIGLLFAVCAFFMLIEQRAWEKGAIVLLVLALGSFAAIYVGHDRWQGAVEAMARAWEGTPDIEALTGSAHPEAKVNRLEPSTYVRMSLARMGLEGILAHPYGLGYGADAFGRFVAIRYGVSGAVSSHSGWIDFALANGILGWALLFALAMALIRRGWLAMQAGNPAGAALALLVTHYFFRAAIDGILSGSRLTGFALIGGALWALSIKDARGAN